MGLLTRDAAALSIRELSSPADMTAAADLQGVVWSPQEATPSNQLLISVKTGGHVIGAWDGESLVAFVYGFPALLPDQTPWIASHMLAVHPDYRGAGIGQELKWRQRDWALVRGFDRLTWTADPLEARNDHLNLNRLGATSGEYIENCYGVMDDQLNAGLPSDRLMLEWRIGDARVADARRGALEPRGAHRVVVPEDFQEVKRRDMGEAMRWRMDVRAALGGHLSAGRRVVGFDRAASALVVD